MIVVINAECNGPSANMSQKILDNFLPRIGRRCWSGRITFEGLLRLKRNLSAKATKANSICCQRVVGTRALEVLWFVGTRGRFNSSGELAVFTSHKIAAAERIPSETTRLCKALVELAALFHDLGKMTKHFQVKLRKGKKIPDIIRHEIISAGILNAMMSLTGSDHAWLAALSTVDGAKQLINGAYAAFFDDPFRYLSASGTAGKSLLAQLQTINPTVTMAAKNGDDNPLFKSVYHLVLSHHRLPNAYPNASKNRIELNLVGSTNMFSKTALDEDKNGIAFNSLFEAPATVCITEDPRYLIDVTRCARKLTDNPDVDQTIVNRVCAVYGRTALILGDHKASAIGNTQFPNPDVLHDENDTYANTSRICAGALAEPLASHMRRTSRESRAAFDVLTLDAADFPGIEHDSIPEAIRSPRADADGPFRWQLDTRKAARQAIKNAPFGSGFFGVLMAETGSGKTRAAPILMSALSEPSGQPLRMIVASGLRSLTLQAGKEYLDDLGFKASQVGVVIGDELTKELFENSNRADGLDVGTEADGHAPIDVVAFSDEGPDGGLPARAMRLFETEKDQIELLSHPVIVCTLDTVMSAADARRGRHTAAMMRIATSDLFIDEIDEFSAEDIAAIGRLVFLSGAFGRKVIISSATVSQIIVQTLGEAYFAGWKLYCGLNEIDTAVVTGLFSNLGAPSVHLSADVADFVSQHARFAKEIADLIDNRPQKRKASVAAFNGVKTVKDMHLALDAHIGDLHSNHCQIDVATGKRVSIGVVRWSNVLPSVLHSRHLCQVSALHPNATIRVIPYNGTLLPAVRDRLESKINKLLKRRHRNDIDPIFSNGDIRKLLDGDTAEDVIIIMVTTSLEETGRDHDFDWVITEPSSLRGLIQMAGRLLRHRDRIPATPNILIMEKTFREVTTRDIRNSSRYLSFPGVETPIRRAVLFPGSVSGPVKLEKLGLKIQNYAVEALFDMVTLAKGVNSKPLVGLEPMKGELPRADAQKNYLYLRGNFSKDEQLSVPEFFSDDLHQWSAFHPVERKFRRSQPTRQVYLDTLESTPVWKCVDGGRCDKDVRTIDLVESGLLYPFFDVFELQSEVGHQLWGDAKKDVIWRWHELLTARPIENHKDELKFAFHPALGLFWDDELLRS